jgi:hypothetical protein
MRRGLAVKSALVVALSGLPLAAHAGDFFGTGALGAFQGNLTVAPVDTDTATLVVTLENTSPAANGGFLTAFVLNNPDDSITSISSFSFSSTDATSAFSLIGLTDNGVAGSPFGSFDFGATTGGGFEGGGDPSTGLDVGETGIFTFTLEGANVDLLTQASFEDELSFNPGGGGAQFFVARFRGFEDDGSDKVPGVIPIPAAAWLFGSGVIGLLGIGRRKLPRS